MFAPAASAASASAQMRVTASSSASGPSATGQVVSIVWPWKTSVSTWRSRSSSSSSRIGFAITSWRACSGRLVEQVPLRADAGLHAHHDRLADRVDRRVRHLREELLEVGVEQRLPVGEDGERQVVPHRADRLLGVPRERREDHLHVVLRVAERELALAQRLGGAGEVRPRRQILEPDDLVSVPLGVRLPRRDGPLHLLVRDDPAVLDVDEEQLPGLQPPLPQHVLRRLVEHARLRREDDPAVPGLEPPARTQAVAVERRADHAPVRERDRRRAVPGLHQALVVGVEALRAPRRCPRGPGRPPGSSS